MASLDGTREGTLFGRSGNGSPGRARTDDRVAWRIIGSCVTGSVSSGGSPPGGACGKRFKSENQIGGYCGRFTTIEYRAAVQLVGYGVEITIGAEAECIDPGQPGIGDQNSVVPIRANNTNGVAGEIAEIDIAGIIDGDAIADRLVRPALNPGGKLLGGQFAVAEAVPGAFLLRLFRRHLPLLHAPLPAAGRRAGPRRRSSDR